MLSKLTKVMAEKAREVAKVGAQAAAGKLAEDLHGALQGGDIARTVGFQAASGDEAIDRKLQEENTKNLVVNNDLIGHCFHLTNVIKTLVSESRPKGATARVSLSSCPRMDELVAYVSSEEFAKSLAFFVEMKKVWPRVRVSSVVAGTITSIVMEGFKSINAHIENRSKLSPAEFESAIGDAAGKILAGLQTVEKNLLDAHTSALESESARESEMQETVFSAVFKNMALFALGAVGIWVMENFGNPALRAKSAVLDKHLRKHPCHAAANAFQCDRVAVLCAALVYREGRVLNILRMGERALEGLLQDERKAVEVLQNASRLAGGDTEKLAVISARMEQLTTRVDTLAGTLAAAREIIAGVEKGDDSLLRGGIGLFGGLFYLLAFLFLAFYILVFLPYEYNSEVATAAVVSAHDRSLDTLQSLPVWAKASDDALAMLNSSWFSRALWDRVTHNVGTGKAMLMWSRRIYTPDAMILKVLPANFETILFALTEIVQNRPDFLIRDSTNIVMLSIAAVPTMILLKGPISSALKLALWPVRKVSEWRAYRRDKAETREIEEDNRRAERMAAKFKDL